MSKPSVTRRHKITVACAACKARKSRCTGSSPCEACLSLGTNCTIDETLDGRRKVALNRRLEDLIHNKWILEGLLLSLRTSSAHDLTTILDLVNTGAPLPELAESISHVLMKLSQSKVKHKASPSYTSPYQEQMCQPDDQNHTEKHVTWDTDEEDDLNPFTLSQQLKEFAHAAAASRKTKTSKSKRRAKLSYEILHLDVRKETYAQTAAEAIGCTDYFPLQDIHSRDEGYQVQGPGQSGVSLDHVVKWLKELHTRTDANEPGPSSHSYDLTYPNGVATTWTLGTHDEFSPSQTTYNELPKKCESPLASQDSQQSGRRKNRPSSNAHSLGQTFPCTSYTNSHPSYTIPSTLGPSPDYVLIRGATTVGEEFTFPYSWNSLQASVQAPPQKSLVDDSSISRAISNYLGLARSTLSKNAALSEVFSLEKPCLNLLFRQQRPDEMHSVSNFAAELIAGMTNIEIPAKIAIAHMFTFLMRWMILPSSENYSRVPELYRPTITQANTAHSPIVDCCPIPVLRDALCRRYRDFFSHLSINLTCNWAYAHETCTFTDHKSGNIFISDAFLQHISHVENWTLKNKLRHVNESIDDADDYMKHPMSTEPCTTEEIMKLMEANGIQHHGRNHGPNTSINGH